MNDPRSAVPVTRVKDGQEWEIGTAAEVAWIAAATTVGLAVTSAVPPVFDAYATILLPEDAGSRAEHEPRVVEALTRLTVKQPWWLGYLDTGADDVVFPDVPRVPLYANWPYVLVKAGPIEALRWRADAAFTMHCRLPDLLFPADRTWLLSALWDDDWWSAGGSASFISAFTDDPYLEARLIVADGDATPPGHEAR